MVLNISKNSAFKPWKKNHQVFYVLKYSQIVDLVEENLKLSVPDDYKQFIKWLDTLKIKNNNGQLEVLETI